MQLIVKLKTIFLVTAIAVGHVQAEQHKILASNGQPGDQFGYSVAIDGDTVLVGAIRADRNAQEDTGAAYVYELGADGWKLKAELLSDELRAGDTLGGNVALKGSDAALGVIGRDDVANNAGAVLLFSRQLGQWSKAQWLTAVDGKAGDAFGQSIALTENTMVIGSPRSDTPEKDSGAAYVFQRVNGRWQFQEKLSAADGAEGDLFGISVAIDDNTILVGADLNDEKAEKAGAVYAFIFDGSQWHQQAKLVAADGDTTDIFGVRVALAADTALISARRDDIEGIGVDAGSAYIFERSRGKWEQRLKLQAVDGQADDRFARAVALSADTAIISAMNHDANGDNTGALYVYRKKRGDWVYSSKIVANDGKAGDRLGWNVALSQNKSLLNVVAASPSRADNGPDAGAVYIQTINY